MLDQGVKGGELSSEPEMEANIRTYLVRHIVQFVPMINHRNSLNGQSSSLRVTQIPGAKPSQNSHLFMKPWAITSRQEPTLALLLERKTQELGDSHDEVIDAKIDLSTVYRRIGKVEKAEACAYLH